MERRVAMLEPLENENSTAVCACADLHWSVGSQENGGCTRIRLKQVEDGLHGAENKLGDREPVGLGARGPGRRTRTEDTASERSRTRTLARDKVDSHWQLAQ